MRERALPCLALLAACGGRPAPPVRPPAVPATAPGAASAEAAVVVAAGGGDENQIDCTDFADDTGPKLCLVSSTGGTDGDHVDYTVYLVVPAAGGGWRTADQVEGHDQARPDMVPEGEFELSVELGAIEAISPTENAIPLAVVTSWSHDEDGGGSSERHQTTVLYWHRGDDLVELFQVDSTYSSSMEDDRKEEQEFEIQEAVHNGFYDVLITTQRVANSWPDDRHTDETEREMLTWNGDDYDRTTLGDDDDDDDEDDGVGEFDEGDDVDGADDFDPDD